MKRRPYHAITGYSPTDNSEVPAPRRSARLLALNTPAINLPQVMPSSHMDIVLVVDPLPVQQPKKADILTLDYDCTRLILERVDVGSLSLLLQVGNKQFETKLRACISVVEIVHSEWFTDQIKTPFLMALLRDCSHFPSLREVRVSEGFRSAFDPAHNIHVTHLLHSLGANLRRLSLSHVVIDLANSKTYVPSYLTNLGNLTTLGLCQLKFSGCTQYVRDQWILDLIRLPSCLERLKLIPLIDFKQDAFAAQVANNLPPSLQALTVTSSVLHHIAKNLWPPYLTKLVIAPDKFLSTDIGCGITIPATVTSLAYKDFTYNNSDEFTINDGFSLANPSALRVLNLQTYRYRGFFRNQTFSHQLSKLSSLQSLTIHWTPSDSPNTYNTALFPRSLTYLDAQILREQWQWLPPNLKVMAPSPSPSSPTLSSRCVRYDATKDVAFAVHLPKSLHSLCMCGGLVPTPLPNVTHIDFRRVSAVEREECDVNLTNVGKSLQSLDISVEYGTFFWLHNDGDLPSPAFTSRFPNLSILHLDRLGRFIETVHSIEAWLNHLPLTICDLKININFDYHLIPPQTTIRQSTWRMSSYHFLLKS